VQGVGHAVYNLSYPNLILACPRYNLFCKALRTKSWQYNCFIFLWRKLMSLTSLSGGRKVATLPPALPVERLLLTRGEILILASLPYNRQKDLKLD
jgi:hypothetical protein